MANKIKVSTEGEAVDIPTMQSMSAEEYAQYVEYELFFIDHHDVLRSAFGEYPIACTETQIDQLISYLEKAKQRFHS